MIVSYVVASPGGVSGILLARMDSGVLSMRREDVLMAVCMTCHLMQDLDFLLSGI